MAEGYYYNESRYHQVSVPTERLTNPQVGRIVKIPQDHQVLDSLDFASAGCEGERYSLSITTSAPSGKSSMLVTKI